MLEDSYTKLAGAVGDLGKEMKRKTDELSNKLNAEATGSEAADKRIEERLKETAVGSFHLDVWGVMFVMVGIFAGTASPEIATQLGTAWCR